MTLSWLYRKYRGGNKGVEPENVAVGTFESEDFLFVNAERACVVYVYDIGSSRNPKFWQALPTNVGPEGGLAIPKAHIFVVANDVGHDHKVRSTITIYEYAKGRHQYPTLSKIPTIPFRASV